MAFPNNCDLRVVQVDESCGCTLTRANITGMTKTDFENQSAKEVGMDRIITRAQEARVAGVMENTLETLLMSRLSPIKGPLAKINIGGSESVILPYIYRRQKRNINSNYWKVETSVAAGGAQLAIHSGARILTLSMHAGSYATSLPSPENYFIPGKYLIVEWLGPAGENYSAQFKIIASTNADSGGVYKADVTVYPNVSTTAVWDAFSASQKLPWQPTSGYAFNLANSVSDYESWCSNEPAENTNKLLTFWLQTSRETHCFNDEYLKALNAALTSGYFKEFRQLPLAEQKRIQHQKFVRDWMNSVFFGQRINELQEDTTYTSLPKVYDAADEACHLEYKANALGVRTILSDCSRVYNHSGNKLSMDLLFSTGYSLKRAREAAGGSVDTIDIMTDRFTAGNIMQVMQKIYKAKYGVETQRFYQPNQKLVFTNQVALTYNVYQLPPELGGYNLAVFTHPFFDDKLAASNSSNRARVVWFIDWSDIQIGIAKTNSVTRQTNVADDLYNCVITPNVKHYQLASTTWTTIIEDPSRHYMIENFQDACPTVSDPTGCELSNV
jgi:hypothetical protein